MINSSGRSRKCSRTMIKKFDILRPKFSRGSTSSSYYGFIYMWFLFVLNILFKGRSCLSKYNIALYRWIKLLEQNNNFNDEFIGVITLTRIFMLFRADWTCAMRYRDGENMKNKSIAMEIIKNNFVVIQVNIKCCFVIVCHLCDRFFFIIIIVHSVS